MAGGVGWERDDYVEYDLDNEDEDWLREYTKVVRGAQGAGSRIQDLGYRIQGAGSWVQGWLPEYAAPYKVVMGDRGGMGWAGGGGQAS